MIYVLACPEFAPETAARINAFRAEHEPERARLVRPHVTLIFGISDEYLQTVTSLLDALSAQTEAVPVSFESCVIEFDPFEEAHKLFLLCGDGQEAFSNLHAGLHDGAHRAELSPEHPFIPHMTIASCSARVDAEQIDVSKIGGLSIKAEVTALTLVRLEAARLTELNTAPLVTKASHAG